MNGGICISERWWVPILINVTTLCWNKGRAKLFR
jgi:hypothetical protein